MKVALEEVDTTVFDVREEYDPDHVSEIAESMENDGQWNPVIVRPSDNGGGYEMVAGHTRLKAADKLGWDEIEATIKNVDEKEAEELALKTNLKRKGMTKIEEGKVVNEMLENQELSQRELADKLGMSQRWVSERVKVALELAPEVKGLVEEGEISYNIARIVTQVEEENQLELANLFIQENITRVAKASKIKNRFLNDTVYTIGYEGMGFEEFVSELKREDIDILLDVRGSSESTYKPQFSGDILSERLGEHGVEYRHEPELGVDYLIRNPYKEGVINDKFFKSWYGWWVNKEADVKLEELVDELNREGTPALMCIEKYPEPKAGQEIFCHRHFLAEMMQGVERAERPMFPNRKDI
jgi:ParB family chromosome partitioning protein